MVLLTMVLLAVVSRPHRYHGNADIASKNQEVNQRITEHPSEPLRIFAAYQKKKAKNPGAIPKNRPKLQAAGLNG